MPGRNPTEAVAAFTGPLADSIACVVRAKITLSPGGRAKTEHIHAFALNADRPVPLNCRPSLLLRVGMLYEIVRTTDPELPPWRVSTRGYQQEVQSDSGEAVISYHWHPTSRVSTPHIHLGRTQLAPDAVLRNKAHVATGRVSLESVIRSCITEYGPKALRDDWEKVLALREGDFQIYRSWS